MSSANTNLSFVLFLSFEILMIGVLILSTWKYFVKAGVKGWNSLVPFYCSYSAYKIARDKTGWTKRIVYILVMLFGASGMFGIFYRIFSAASPDDSSQIVAERIIEGYSTPYGIAHIVIFFIALVLLFINSFRFNLNLAKAFGHSVVFAFGLTVCSIVFVPVLGFGNSTYIQTDIESMTFIEEKKHKRKKDNK